MLGVLSYYDASWYITSRIPIEILQDVAFVIIIAGIVGVVYFVFFSLVFQLYCKAFKCKSNITKALKIFAWSRIPLIIGGLLATIYSLSKTPETDLANFSLQKVDSFNKIHSIIQYGFVLWSIIIFVAGIRKVYKLKLGRAILLGILPSVLLLD